MRVVLKENIENLGKKGDVIEVARGYGRNYLLPKKLAIEVTPSNMKMIEMEQQALKRRFEQEKASHQEIIEKINETRLTFFRKTAEKDVIFGSVSSADIKEALEKLGIEVDKKKIVLEEPIKRLGNYSVPIKIYHEEPTEVKIEVVKEGEKPAAETEEKKETASGEKTKESKQEETKEEEVKAEAEKAKKEMEGEELVKEEEEERPESKKAKEEKD